MNDNIRLLEDRVHRAVDRLKQLNGERARLESEVRLLKAQLEARQAGEAERAGRTPGAGADEWPHRRDAIVAELEAALQDLGV
jgi:hypothetical protein